MDERRIKQAAIEAVRFWLSETLGATQITARNECRTTDGRGRADALVAFTNPADAIDTVVIEAKSRFTRGGLAARRTVERPELHTSAALQLDRYPGNYRVLAGPDDLLRDHPADRELLRALCQRDGIGLLTVNWYREWVWLLHPGRIDTPLLWPDCLDGYAAGPVLRARLQRAADVTGP